MKCWHMLLATAMAAPLVMATAAHADDLDVGETTFGGKVFINASHLNHKVNGRQAHDSGTDVDLKRLFLNVEHRFSPVWSARVTTDIHRTRTHGPTDLWVRYAYLQGAFDKAFKLRLGSASLPWPGLVNSWSGFRYVDKELITRVGAGGSVDWGVHALGDFGARDAFSYQVSVVTGAGYKKPRLGNGPDVSGSLAWQPTAHTVVALGGYRGKLAKDAGQRHAQHKAQRMSVMAAYKDAVWRVGGQYFRARNWDRVLKTASDRRRGWSVWGSMQVTPDVALFARHDKSSPSRYLQPDRRGHYTNVGVEWSAPEWLRLAAVYKRGRMRDHGRHLETTHEVGLWAQIVF